MSRNECCSERVHYSFAVNRSCCQERCRRPDSAVAHSFPPKPYQFVRGIISYVWMHFRADRFFHYDHLRIQYYLLH